MKRIPRRAFLQGALTMPLAGAALAQSDARGLDRRLVHLTAGQDRFGHRRNVFGSLPIDVKVAGSDTGGGLLLIEQINDRPGGPPRHVHHGQEEWFYVLDGSYVIEVGAERFELGLGDSVLAPRGIPHVWAHTGTLTGRLLIGFQPAGEMEDFFAAATQLEGIPATSALARLFTITAWSSSGRRWQIRTSPRSRSSTGSYLRDSEAWSSPGGELCSPCRPSTPPPDDSVTLRLPSGYRARLHPER